MSVRPYVSNKNNYIGFILFKGGWNNQGGLWDGKRVHKGKGCGRGVKDCMWVSGMTCYFKKCHDFWLVG